MVATTEKRTLLIERRSGKRARLTIPADAKVTLAGFNPGKPTGYGPEVDTALRVYVGTQQNQVAVIRDVIAFRDMSLDWEEEKVTTKRDTKAKRSEDRAELSELEEIAREWVKDPFSE